MQKEMVHSNRELPCVENLQLGGDYNGPPKRITRIPETGCRLDLKPKRGKVFDSVAAHRSINKRSKDRVAVEYPWVSFGSLPYLALKSSYVERAGEVTGPSDWHEQLR